MLADSRDLVEPTGRKPHEDPWGRDMRQAPDAERCHGEVLDASGWGRRYRCPFRGKAVRDGKLYCRHHDPERIAARQKAREVRLFLGRHALQQSTVRRVQAIKHQERRVAALEELLVVAKNFRDALDTHGREGPYRFALKLAIRKVEDTSDPKPAP